MNRFVLSLIVIIGGITGIILYQLVSSEQQQPVKPSGFITTDRNQYVLPENSSTLVYVFVHVFNGNGGGVNLSVKSPDGEDTEVFFLPISGNDDVKSDHFQLGLASQLSEAGTYHIYGAYDDAKGIFTTFLNSTSFTVKIQNYTQSNSTQTISNKS